MVTFKYTALIATLICSFASAQQLPLGIIGGEDNSGFMPAYAALVYPSQAVLPLTLSLSSRAEKPGHLWPGCKALLVRGLLLLNILTNNGNRRPSARTSKITGRP